MISDSLLSDVIRDLDEGVYVLDAELRLIFMNAKAERLLGWRLDELRGRGFHDAVHYQKADGTAVPAAECPVHKVIELGRSYRTDDDVFTRRDGALLPVRYVSTPILRDGKVVAVGTVFHEIAAEKAAAAREALLREIDHRVVVGHPLEYILQFVCEGLVELYDFPLVRVVLRAGEQALRVAAEAGEQEGLLEGREESWWGGESLTRQALRGGRSQSAPTPAFGPLLRALFESAGIEGAMALPLRSPDRAHGTLELFAGFRHHFDSDTVGHVEELVERIAVILMVAREQQQLRLQGTAMATAANAIMITDRSGAIEWVNPAFTDLSGYSAAEVLGENPRFLKSDHHDPEFYRELWHTIAAGYPWKGEVVQRHKDGRHYTVEQTITPLRDVHGEISHYVAIHQDITERKEAERHIQQLAFYDVLTGLPNRRLFQEHLERAVVQARRDEELAALLYVDLDRFKDVNDSLGHDVGDALLREVAGRVKACLRASDSVARLGGDEFAIIQTGLTHVDGAATLAQKIIDCIGEPFRCGGRELFTGSSIGITIYPFDDSDIHSLLANADTAMYRAKAVGRNVYQFFTVDMNVAVQRRLILVSELHKALEEGQFELHYQPQVSLASGEMVGVEALVRWHHPERGLLAPGEFIPVAEESGVIVALGEWVLREACRQNVAWQRDGLPTVRMAVNISARQFRQGNLVTLVGEALAESGLAADLLELELTESLLMDDIENAVSTLQLLHELGVHIAIDDFGTGFSSMGYLKRFPVDKLKIAGLFVRDLDHDRDDAAISQAIINMGHNLRMKVIAEGVETDEQARFLREQGCDEKQGFLFSRPLPAGELERLLRQGRRLEVS